MRKVLVTGVNGLIGRHLPYFLAQRGYETWGVGRQRTNDSPYLHYRCADLFDSRAVQALCEEIRPEYLIHLAWDTRPGICLQENANYQWLESGINLLRNFHLNGGKRAVFAGTCLEYGFQTSPLKEDAPLNPLTPYAFCKNLLHSACSSFTKKNGMGFVWGRIFYVYGRGEHENRLFPYIIRNLKSGQPAIVRTAQLVKDYMFAEDISAAFACLLDSSANGSINVCSGEGRSVGSIASIIAEALDQQEFLVLENYPTTEPHFIVGDNSRLTKEAGFETFTPLESGINVLLQTGEL